MNCTSAFPIATQAPPLRIVVTANCNFHCIYCSQYGENLFSLGNILSERDLPKVLKIADHIGIKDYRITGGEPLLFIGFVSKLFDYLADLPNTQSIQLTTNGSLLTKHVDYLDNLPRLDLLKVSLDTIRPKEFERVTGVDELTQVMKGILCAIESGLRVRINTVVTRITLSGIWEMLSWCCDNNLSVKLLDVNQFADPGSQLWKNLYVPLIDIRNALRDESDSVCWTHGLGGYGIPMEEFSWNGIQITVKDSSIGTTYSTLCKDCPLLWSKGISLYCQEGLYNLTLTTDGNLIMCRHRADLAVSLTKSIQDSKIIRNQFCSVLDRFSNAYFVEHQLKKPPLERK